jgi:hypothetical protein
MLEAHPSRRMSCLEAAENKWLRKTITKGKLNALELLETPFAELPTPNTFDEKHIEPLMKPDFLSMNGSPNHDWGNSEKFYFDIADGVDVKPVEIFRYNSDKLLKVKATNL